MPDPVVRRIPQRKIASANIQVNVTGAPLLSAARQPLPAPTGQPPYHLTLDSIVSAAQMQDIKNKQSFFFHVAGDTGGVKAPQPQQIVADHMAHDFDNPDTTTHPAFLYHVGDVVYYYGEASQYYSQYYEPYQHYPAPIVAIPGNHDGDVFDPTLTSLAAFVENFCAPSPQLTKEAGDVPRDAMTQPNVYWTMDTPFVTFIGLYTNVPEGGWMDATQIDWLNSELSNAPTDKALIISLHHPIYSADVMHSGSKYMSGILDEAIAHTNRYPDMVLTGHVHNYQRFTRTVAGRDIPYIVAGAGGYWHLHSMLRDAQHHPLPKPYPVPGTDVSLINYCDDHHGYLLMEATPTALKGLYYTVPRPQDSWSAPATLLDTFTLDWKAHKISQG